MKKRVDYSLYLCTDRGLMTSPTIERSVELALRGGASVVQLREKDCSSREFYELGLRVRAITDRFGVPLIVNDRVDIALAVGAAGVHIGQSDLPCRAVRALVGEEGIVGVSASTLEQAVQAERDGADYLGIGAMNATDTKTDAALVTPEQFEEIRRAVRIPLVVIGGVNASNIAQYRRMGADGAAVVSAIVAQPDVEAAARELLTLWRG